METLLGVGTQCTAKALARRAALRRGGAVMFVSLRLCPEAAAATPLH